MCVCLGVVCTFGCRDWGWAEVAIEPTYSCEQLDAR